MIVRLKNITWPDLPAGVSPDWIRLESLVVKASALGTWTARWVSNINNDQASTTYAEQVVTTTLVDTYETFGPLIEIPIARAALDSPTFGLRLQFVSSPGGGTATVDEITLRERHTVAAASYSGFDWGATPDLAEEHQDLLCVLAAIHDLEGALDDNAAMAAVNRYDQKSGLVLDSLRQTQANVQTSNSQPPGAFFGRLKH